MNNERESNAVLMGYRLAPQQRQLWQQSAAITYGAQSVIRLRGSLNIEALRTAIAGVVEQHEILRTNFQRQPGMRTPVQVISEQPELCWYEAAAQERDIDLACEADRRADRDSSDAVLRVSLLRLADQHHVLVLTLPTLCADYTSLSLLTGQIVRAYDECISGELTPGEFLQYADFCEWQNELVESEDAAAGRAFWLNQQAAISNPLRLPFEARSVSATVPERLSFTLPP